LAKIRTFIDSNVLIAAARGTESLAERAFAILDDPERELVTSDFIRLETLPKARFHKQADEVAFYEEFFKAASRTVEASKQLVDQAQAEAESSGLQAFDALHVVAALKAEADVLITAEKADKTIFWTKLVPIKTIRPAAVEEAGASESQ
jgi:predicted nucleic acid-binding protein